MKSAASARVTTTAARRIPRTRTAPLALVALVVLAVAAFPAPAESAVIYVDWNAPGATHDGTSWGTAYHFLSQALSQATANDAIWVAQGLYYPDEGPGQTAGDRSSSFLLVDGVAVYGGFDPQAGADTWAERDPDTYLTVLSGDLSGDDTADGNGVVLDWANIVGTDNAYHVVSVPAGATVVLDGFTVTAGSADDDLAAGAGLLSLIGSHSTLDHMVFRGNKASSWAGGGAFFSQSTQAVTDTKFIGNLSHWGGGAYSLRGSTTFLHVVFQANDAAGGAAPAGGGLVTDLSAVTLEDVQFNANTAEVGGGLLADAPITLTKVSFDGNSGSGLVDYGCSRLTDVTFTNNTNGEGGGALAQCGSAPAVYTRVSFVGNTAGLGGGLYYHATAANNTLDVVDGVFVNNHASGTGGRGGAIYVYYGPPSSLRLTNTLIRGNRADCTDDGGGAIFGLYGCATLINSTVTGNGRSALWWRGIAEQCNWIIKNSIVWGNTGVPVNGGPGSVFSYSIMQNYHDYSPSLTPDAPCGVWATCDHTSFTTDPLFVTPVDPTTAPTTAGDVHLLATSPAMDAGDNAAVPADVGDLDGDGNTTELLPFDLDGNRRRLDGPVTDTGNGTAPIVDIGAYEYGVGAASAVELGSSSNPALIVQSVTLTATVSDPSLAGTPTGTVTFRDDGVLIAGCADLALSPLGVATCGTSWPAAASHTLSVRYSGDATFAWGGDELAQQVIEVSLTPQTITFGNPGSQKLGTTPTLTATASSGLPVTFTSSTTGVCTVTTGGTLAFLTVGDCTIDADQAGDTTWAPADTVTQTFAVTPAAQTITFDNPGSQQLGTSPTLTATASSGLTVTFTSRTTGVCAITASGVLTFQTVGTCAIDADQAGNTTWAPADTVTQTFAVTPAAQTITFDNPGSQKLGTTPTLTATASSGLAVTFTSSTTGVCTITTGGALTFLTVGDCTIDADQAGDTAWAPAETVTQTFAVTPAAQTITFDNPGSQKLGTTPTLTATASSGLAVTFTSSTTGVCTVTTGGTLTFLTVGDCTIDADQAGDSAWAPADTVTQTFAVTPAAQTITFDNPGSQKLGTTPTLTAIASSGLPVTFTSSTTGVCTITAGGTLAFLVVGDCTIDADQAGDTAWAAAETVTQTFAVASATQTITFDNPGSQKLGTTPTLTATASSGLPVTFSSSTTGVCTITAGGTLAFLTVGDCTIDADQEGDATWAHAETVTQTFAVTPAAQTITFDNPGPQKFGTTPALAATASSGLPVTFTSSTTGVCTTTAGGTLSFLTVGDCTIDADQAGDTAWAAAETVTQTFAVTPATQAISFDNPGSHRLGTAPTLTAIASSGLPVTFTSCTAAVCSVSTGGTLTFLTVGDCTINADQEGDCNCSRAETVTQTFAVMPALQADGIPLLDLGGLVILGLLLAVTSLVVIQRRAT